MNVCGCVKGGRGHGDKSTLLIISPTVSHQTLNTEGKRKKATITDKKRETAVLAELR